MTSTLASLSFDAAGFESFLRARHEPDWLTHLRREAWDKFSASAWPTSSDEEWRRTDIRLFRLDKFHLPAEETTAADHAEEIQPLLSQGIELGGSVRTVNGRFAHANLHNELASKGVIFGSLERAASEHQELVQENLLTRAVDPNYDRFAMLHAACWSGGTFLYVPRGVKLDRPLHVQSVLVDGGSDLSHTLIVLDEGAEATVLVECEGDESEAFHCGATEIVLGARSRLRFVGLQEWGRKTWHFAHQKAIVDRGAALQWTIGALGGKLAKVNQHVALVGPDADAQVNGVIFTEDRQHISYHTLQHHEAPRCHSDLLYKGALQDKSRTVWRGMIKVDPAAQQTDGYQRDDSLLLSEDARSDSIPGLEIEADDVRCTHGATAGRVDEEPIFYLRSRGLTKNEAVRMYVSGFFQQVFDRITIETVRNALADAIGRRIREYK